MKDKPERQYDRCKKCGALIEKAAKMKDIRGDVQTIMGLPVYLAPACPKCGWIASRMGESGKN